MRYFFCHLRSCFLVSLISTNGYSPDLILFMSICFSSVLASRVRIAILQLCNLCLGYRMCSKNISCILEHTQSPSEKRWRGTFTLACASLTRLMIWLIYLFPWQQREVAERLRSAEEDHFRKMPPPRDIRNILHVHACPSTGNCGKSIQTMRDTLSRSHRPSDVFSHVPATFDARNCVETDHLHLVYLRQTSHLA